MATKFIPKPYRVERNDCQAMLVDIQDRLISHIFDHEKIINKASILIQGLQALNIPIMVNEQYPKGLGHTLPTLLDIISDKKHQIFEKTTFSVCDTPGSWNYVAQQNRNNVILFGIEAHVCVMQTALDLLDNGMQPIIVTDAIGSRDPYDRKIAIRRMRRAGAVVTTTEAILFELCRSSEDPAFKLISNLIK